MVFVVALLRCTLGNIILGGGNFMSFCMLIPANVFMVKHCPRGPLFTFPLVVFVIGKIVRATSFAFRV
jgi:hypothetical protein